jgi:hypothetical protein
MQQVILFWFAMTLIQDLVITGNTDLTQIDRLTIPGELSRWWLGEEGLSDEEVNDD